MNDMSEFIEITLPKPENFLLIKETLTRIGIASKKEKALYQSCHVLHKQGRYYILHFKELFKLDGKEASISLNDIARRNRIALLLEEWNLCDIISPSDDIVTSEEWPLASLKQIKIIPFAEKKDWSLREKIRVGVKR